MKPGLYVVRTHSHTDKQQLWKVMSRPLVNMDSAESWRDFVKSEEKNKKRQFAIVEVRSVK
jgi:hypothetical protein